ncbi:MAG: S8 family serine peptidase [Vicinamibacterales bacterium]
MHRLPSPTRAARWCLLLGLAALLPGPPVLRSQGRPPATMTFGGRRAMGTEVLVKYKAIPTTRRRQIEAGLDADATEAIGRGAWHRVRSRSLDAGELVRRLSRQPDVEYAEPNYVLYAFNTPNDPSFGSLWGLFNGGASPGWTAGADVKAVSAWDVSTGSKSIVVGVVDTGVDYTHADLAPNMWSAPWAFTVNIAGQNIACAAGSHGFNAITRTCDPMDDTNPPHGTHTAGTIGASGNNGYGITGVNWNVSLMGLKFIGANGQGLTSDAINAINFAVQAKSTFASVNGADVRVLSNSWGGGGFSQALLDAINSANSAGALFVAAAGNSAQNIDASPVYPAAYTAPNVVSVAATDQADGLASFSNYGATNVDLGAPGVGIYSTALNQGYTTLSGTSMATPHVSGAAALVMSMCSATIAEVKSLLLSSVDPVQSLSGKTATGGRLNIARAMSSCAQPLVTGVGLTSDKAAPQAPGTSITFTATATGGASPHQFRWFVFDGTTWTPLTGWGTANTYTWTPSTANAGYQIRAAAKSAGNSGGYETFSTVNYAIMPLVSGVTLTADKTAPQSPGATVTFTATAAGGQAPYYYRWFISTDGSTWTPLTAWGAANTYTWTPATGNAGYQIRALAKGTWNPGIYENYATLPFAIQPMVTGVTLTSDKAAPQAPGTTVTFTASASGGTAPYLYRFFVFDGATWTPLTNWGSSATYAWTPSSANAAYQVRAAAKGSWNSGGYENFTTVNYAVMPMVSGVTIASDKAAPQPLGTTVTFTATASGGQAPYLYRWFFSTDGSTWTPLTAWGSANTFTWTPATANAGYQMRALAKGSWNGGIYENYTTVNYPVLATVSSVGLTADKVAPQPPNTTVTFTASASGGVGPYLYRFFVFDGATWTPVTNWTSTATYAWTPSIANANYQVRAAAKGSWNGGVYEAFNTLTFPVMPLVSSVSLVANKAAPQASGTTITFTATAAGGQGPYLYRWFISTDGTTWTPLTGWATPNTYAWTPGTANANYQIRALAKGSWNPGMYENYTTLPFAVQ